MFGAESFRASSPENIESEKIPLRRLGHWKRLIAKIVLGASLAAGGGFGAESQTQEAQKQGIELKQDKRESILKQYRKNFELLKNEIEREKLRDKVSLLKQKYGGVLNNFFVIHRIESDLEFLDKVEKRKDSAETFVRLNPYVMTPGSIVSNAYELRWRKPEIGNKGFSSENLESIPGFDKAKFQELLGKYPGGYLESSLSGVRFSSRVNVRGGVEILGEVRGYDMERLSDKDTRSPMIIYNTKEGMDFEGFADTFKHEVHHGNDWQNNHLLTSTERINMLLEVTGRIESDDRYRSQYVEGLDEAESIQRLKQELPQGTSPEQVLLYVKATEYWAEIAKAYFENPDGFKVNHPKDYELAKRWVARLSGEGVK
jgi:hypothetical protein